MGHFMAAVALIGRVSISCSGENGMVYSVLETNDNLSCKCWLCFQQQARGLVVFTWSYNIFDDFLASQMYSPASRDDLAQAYIYLINISIKVGNHIVACQHACSVF